MYLFIIPNSRPQNYIRYLSFSSKYLRNFNMEFTASSCFKVFRFWLLVLVLVVIIVLPFTQLHAYILFFFLWLRLRQKLWLKWLTLWLSPVPHHQKIVCQRMKNERKLFFLWIFRLIKLRGNLLLLLLLVKPPNKILSILINFRVPTLKQTIIKFTHTHTRVFNLFSLFYYYYYCQISRKLALMRFLRELPAESDQQPNVILFFIKNERVRPRTSSIEYKQKRGVFWVLPPPPRFIKYSRCLHVTALRHPWRFLSSPFSWILALH